MRMDLLPTNSQNRFGGIPRAIVQRWIVVGILCSLAALALGCGREHCDQLVRAACVRLEEQSDGPERCEHLKKLAESVDDDQCKENLRILKESGKLQSQ